MFVVLKEQNHYFMSFVYTLCVNVERAQTSKYTINLSLPTVIMLQGLSTGRGKCLSFHIPENSFQRKPQPQFARELHKPCDIGRRRRRYWRCQVRGVPKRYVYRLVNCESWPTTHWVVVGSFPHSAYNAPDFLCAH